MEVVFESWRSSAPSAGRTTWLVQWITLVNVPSLLEAERVLGTLH